MPHSLLHLALQLIACTAILSSTAAGQLHCAGTSPTGETTSSEMVLPNITSVSPSKVNETAATSGTSASSPDNFPGSMPTLARRHRADGEKQKIAHSSSLDVTQILKSLGIVLALFAGFVWVLQRLHRSTPTEDGAIFQLLGEFRLLRRQKAFVLKFGDRILVLCESGRGLQKLSEIVEPAEVQLICEMCAHNPPGQNFLPRNKERQLRNAFTRDQMSFTPARDFV